jgi:hypothetical protein
MPQIPVVGYSIAWNPRANQGKIALRLQNSPQPQELLVETAEEFTALTMLLNESPVWYVTETGFIVTGWEQVGGT